MIAAYRGRSEVVKWLCEAKADVQCKSEVSCVDAIVLIHVFDRICVNCDYFQAMRANKLLLFSRALFAV